MLSTYPDDSAIKVGDMVYRENFLRQSLGRVIEKIGSQVTFNVLTDEKDHVWSCDAALLRKLPADHPVSSYPAEWVQEVLKGHKKLTLETLNELFGEEN